MKQELIKPIVKVGNSAGVLLPREWLNGKAKIELVEKPLNIKKDVLEILDPHLEDIIGIYLVGSYARNEQTKESDIDIMAVTNKTSNRIKQGKYDILLITKEDVEKVLKYNVLPILPMLKEAETIINKDYLNSVKDILNKKALKWHIEIVKSALKIDKGLIELEKEYSDKSPDSIAYSLILSLRSEYIVDSLRRNKIAKTRELVALTRKITGSAKLYEGYLRTKNNKKRIDNLPISEAEKLLYYLEKKIKEQEKWIKRKD